MASISASAYVHDPVRREPRSRWATKLSCTVWGHHVDNHTFKRASEPGRQCRCGAAYLAEDGSLTRVRHTLACFLGHHTYERLTVRDGYHEYVCVQCGHPLLFHADRDPYATTTRFGKKVRYLCGLFGHRVHLATTRDGFAEYACHCGHTFLKPGTGLSKITHPPVCVAAGHFIRFVTRRAGYAEYRLPLLRSPLLLCRFASRTTCGSSALSVLLGCVGSSTGSARHRHHPVPKLTEAHLCRVAANPRDGAINEASKNALEAPRRATTLPTSKVDKRVPLGVPEARFFRAGSRVAATRHK